MGTPLTIKKYPKWQPTPAPLIVIVYIHITNAGRENKNNFTHTPNTSIKIQSKRTNIKLMIEMLSQNKQKYMEYNKDDIGDDDDVTHEVSQPLYTPTELCP